MNAKEYLKQIKRYDTLINNKLEELQRLKDLSTKITTSLSLTKVQTSGNTSKIANSVEKLIDLQEEINDDIDKFIDLRTEVISNIDKIQNSDMCNVLYKRYLDLITWEQIAVDMHFTSQWVHKLHNRALKEIQEIIDKDNTSVL